MMSGHAATNRDRALRAALQIVGDQGIRALTHGRVDSTAGLPAGSTSNHFRTRAALIHATVDHLASVEQDAFAVGKRPQTVEELVDALVGFIQDAGGPLRQLTVARFVFFVEGFHDAQVRDALARARARIEAWAAQTLEALGFTYPFAAARRILTHVDGTIFQRLTFGDLSDVRNDVEALIRSCEHMTDS